MNEHPFLEEMEIDFSPESEERPFSSILTQYKKVIVTSLLTSFGLDQCIADRHGGDVDTIHNVRNGVDYKNEQNRSDYENRGEYDTRQYHQNKDYIETNRTNTNKRKSGELIDPYTGKKFPANEKHNLDHVISAYEIDNDPGRILAGVDGPSLANTPENLVPTSERLNKSKKADSVDTYIQKHPDMPKSQQKRMRTADRKARAEYDRKLNQTYYTSEKFRTDTALAAGTLGASMGLRQALGFVFAEVWFSVEDEIDKMPGEFEFAAIARGVGTGFGNGVDKFKTVFEKFRDGAVSGIISSLTTTLCNIFFTTAKNFVKIIRQAWASIVEATKVLFLNPDNLSFGQQMKVAMKAIATGASIVIGVVVQEAVSKIPALAAIPVISEIVPIFCGALVTGILTISFLYFLDRSEMIKKLLSFADWLTSGIDKNIAALKSDADNFTAFAAELMKLDLAKFQKETLDFYGISSRLENAKTPSELNRYLLQAYNQLGIKLPWTGDFDEFMSDRNNRLVFE